jgi:hypothetical protein
VVVDRHEWGHCLVKAFLPAHKPKDRRPMTAAARCCRPAGRQLSIREASLDRVQALLMRHQERRSEDGVDAMRKKLITGPAAVAIMASPVAAPAGAWVHRPIRGKCTRRSTLAISSRRVRPRTLLTANFVTLHTPQLEIATVVIDPRAGPPVTCVSQS